ncbi:MAG: hypothetical protein BWY74_01219 [Firmicutes bacterium ADurb.Bin419]|nr:MAG: hypothetical protein BWY74_01219 [Firmicutes bacterium ADurb.Bin419]
MFTNIIPKFDRGRILKKEMLENMRDYPRNFNEIYFKGYSNGIISGADICVCESTIIINKGIIKHEGIIYMLDSEFEVPYYPTNKEVLIKVRFEDEDGNSDFRIYSSGILIDDNTEIAENEIELGRFKLREGAILRSEYKDFYDFSTEYNTVNVINVQYAGIKKYTISPMILNYFANIIMKNNPENNMDIVFAFECLNGGAVEREAILHYISNRLGMEYKDYPNLQIYKYLSVIVRELESGKKRKMDLPNKPVRIIVD